MELHVYHHFPDSHDPIPIPERLLLQILSGNAAIAASLSQLSKDIKTMSGTLSEQLDAATSAIETDVAAVASEVTQLLASMTPGSQVTQAQIDRLTAIDTAMKAIPPATPVVIPPPAA